MSDSAAISIENDVVGAAADESDDKAGKTVMYDVDPARWGGKFWSTYHLIAYAYPEEPNKETRDAAFAFFDSMRSLVPCSECRDGYRERWQQYDLRQHLDTRASLIEWVILMHDSVNEKLGVPPLDYAAFMESLIGESVVDDEPDEESNERLQQTTLDDNADCNARERNPKQRKREREGRQKRTQALEQRKDRWASERRTIGQNEKMSSTSAPQASKSGLWKNGMQHAQRLQSEQFRQSRIAAGKSSRFESYHAARFAMRSRMQSAAAAKSKSVASRVHAPRECENCNRKNFVPSVFS